MERRRLLILLGIELIAVSILTWHFCTTVPAPPFLAATQVDPKELAHLANLERQRKDGIIPPASKRERTLTQEERLRQQQATPVHGTSFALLNLDHVPSETDLIKAGHMRGRLSSTFSADSASIIDPDARARQEKDNILFGGAMNAWNQKKFTEAIPLLIKHLNEYPDSPWAAESRLHLATSALEMGHYDGCYAQVARVLEAAPAGSDVYQKAMLLKARALTLQQKIEDASKAYLDAIATETDSRRKAAASSWLVALSYRTKKQS